MDSILSAKIAVDHTAFHFDMAYDYLVPSRLQPAAVEGCRVLVPFGGGNQTRQGIILKLTRGQAHPNSKEILDVLDEKPLLLPEMLKLAVWMKERCFCTLFDAIKAMLPSGIQYRLAVSYCLNPDVPPQTLSSLPEAGRRAVQYLAKCQSPVRREKLLSVLGLEPADSLPEELLRRNVLQKNEDAVRRMGDAAVRMLRLTGEATDEKKLTPKQREVFLLLQREGEVSLKEVCYYTGVSTAVINALVKKGAAEYFESERYRVPQGGTAPVSIEAIRLTEEQQKAYDSLYCQFQQGRGSVSLLYGVTGSGKTSVFLKLIDQVSRQGRGVIMMVPEISLTPQMISLFQARYGKKVAVFHSALSLGERMDEWKRVKNGEACIAIGTRSAVFAPFQDIGLIIMDEEQEYTYKSESNPRFHARDVAKFRCRYHSGLLLLCSATPSLESYYAAQQGRYSLNTLTTRYGNARLPKVTVADMNEELLEGNNSSYSMVLQERLKENLRLGRQSILLLNRRGYHTFVSCRACGEVLTCPHCSISMTYHSANNRLMCHYCGYSLEFTDECPSCHQHQVKYSGMGTQRAEEELRDLLPNARLLRMDADSTMSRFAHEKMFKQFADGEYDILLGTQMVAKGLNFPNVTLVGVLSADQTLYSDDFRSYERAFSLFTQVVGRSGRGDLAGHAVIQTFTPENPVIRMAAMQDYQAFYQSEIPMRKAMLYPPFVELCVVGFVGLREEKTRQAAQSFFERFTHLAKSEYKHLPLRVLGPSSASVAKVSNKYRYKMIIKCRNDKYFRQMLSRVFIDYGKDRKYNDVTAYADMNPDIIL